MTKKGRARIETEVITVAVTITVAKIAGVVSSAVAQVAATESLCVTSVKSKVIQQTISFQILTHFAADYRTTLKNQSGQQKSKYRAVLKTKRSRQLFVTLVEWQL